MLTTRLCARASQLIRNAGSRAHASFATSARVSAPASAQTLEAPEDLEKKYLLGTYSADGVRLAPGVAFVKGKGCKLWDNKGKEYLDWAAGIAVNALGHSDDGIAAELDAAARSIQHTSNLFHTYPPLLLARDLVQSTQHFQKAFFCNSGTEANEAAIKFARKFALWRARVASGGSGNDGAPAYGCKGVPPTSCVTTGGVCACWEKGGSSSGRRQHILAFKGGFHGRTLGSLSVTHKPSIRAPFAPFPGDVSFGRFNDASHVREYLTRDTAAILVEPVQGEGGVTPATPEFMRALRAAADEVGALLIVDEVQCGLGRSGRLWAHEAYGVRPDAMTLAKPLAGGLPIGAVLLTDALAASVAPGDHGTTFGGNPLVAAVARHVFARIAAPDFLALAAAYPSVVADVRGTLDGGLFAGFELRVPPKPLVAAAAARGLLIITAGETVVRVCPPLIISEQEVARGLDMLAHAMRDVFGPAAAAATA